MGNRKKRLARVAEQAAKRDRDAKAFTDALAPKSKKPVGRPPLAVLGAIAVVIALLGGGAYLSFGGGGQIAHPPMKIWSGK